MSLRSGRGDSSSRTCDALGKYQLESHLKFRELEALVDAAAREADRLGLTIASFVLRMARFEISTAEPEESCVVPSTAAKR